MHFSRRCANIFSQSRDAIKNPGVAKFGIALEWGSRGLEFESRHSDQKRAFSMKMPVFYNFLKDIIFLKLALLPIYYQCPKRLQSVGDAAETIHIHVLIVPEHFGGGAADETQLVLVGSRYVLKQRGKGMAAAVGRVAVTNDAVALLQKGARAIGALTAPAGGAGRRRENHHR